MRRARAVAGLLLAFGVGFAVAWFGPPERRARETARAVAVVGQALANGQLVAPFAELEVPLDDAVVGTAHWDGERHVVPLLRDGQVVAFCGVRDREAGLAIAELATPSRSWRRR